MQKNNNTFITCFLILFISLNDSCVKKKDGFPVNVIPVASTVGDYSVLNLSDYATEIKYIPLETNDAVLISPINLQIIYENEKILIRDNSPAGPNSYLFDNTGKFCSKIGQRGQGPDDYLSINDVSMNENFIFLMERLKILIYDTTGRLVKNINWNSDLIPEEYRQASLRKIIPLKNDVFVVTVVTSQPQSYYPTAFLFEMYQSAVKTIKEYPSSIVLDKLRGFSNTELGIMHRYKDEVRIYKVANDTIFTIGQNKEMNAAFIFELGKYKPTLSFLEGKERGDNGELLQFNRRKYIFPNVICESLNHLFIKFSFGNHSPEPYETSHLGQQYTNYDVYGIFDKSEGKLTLMHQPVKGKLGFKNDIDNGPVIFPHYISSNNELITYVLPDEFMEYYACISNPSVALKEIAEKLKIDDNPILIVAKLN